MFTTVVFYNTENSEIFCFSFVFLHVFQQKFTYRWNKGARFDCHRINIHSLTTCTQLQRSRACYKMHDFVVAQVWISPTWPVAGRGFLVSQQGWSIMQLPHLNPALVSLGECQSWLTVSAREDWETEPCTVVPKRSAQKGTQTDWNSLERVRLTGSGLFMSNCVIHDVIQPHMGLTPGLMRPLAAEE